MLTDGRGLTPKGQKWGKLQMLSPTPEVGMMLLKLLPSCEQVQVTAYIFPGGCIVGTAEGHTTLGPVPLGEHMTDLKLWQLPAGLCLYRHSLHIPTLSAVFLLLPGPSEQVSSNQLLLSPCLAQVGNRHWRAAYKQVGPKPKLSTKDCVPKEEEGNSLVQTQKQQIKSPQLTW